MILSVITAVGAAGVPGGSLPLLMGVLAAVNVEPLTIAMIIGVDRILDMARTTINVVGDMSAAGVRGPDRKRVGSAVRERGRAARCLDGSATHTQHSQRIPTRARAQSGRAKFTSSAG